MKEVRHSVINEANTHTHVLEGNGEKHYACQNTADFRRLIFFLRIPAGYNYFSEFQPAGIRRSDSSWLECDFSMSVGISEDPPQNPAGSPAGWPEEPHQHMILTLNFLELACYGFSTNVRESSKLERQLFISRLISRTVVGNWNRENGSKKKIPIRAIRAHSVNGG